MAEPRNEARAIIYLNGHSPNETKLRKGDKASLYLEISL